MTMSRDLYADAFGSGHTVSHTPQMDYASIITAIMDASGMNQTRLAKRFKVSQATVSRWRKFQKPGIEYHEQIVAMAKHYGVLKAERSALDGERGLSGVSTAKPYSPQLPGGMPDVDASAGAGPGGLSIPSTDSDGAVVFAADAVRGEIVLPGYIIAEFTRASPQRIHWIRVRGDSMESTLAPGDRVGVDTTDTAIGQGGVFVIRDSDGEILVKRLRKVRGTNAEIEIVSDNPKQGNEIVPAGDIGIVGRVVARICRVG